MTLDAAIAAIPEVLDELRALRREVRELRAVVGSQAGRWLSRADAAEALGVSVDSIDRRCRDGSLRFRRTGRLVRILIEPPPTEREVAALASDLREVRAS